MGIEQAFKNFLPQLEQQFELRDIQKDVIQNVTNGHNTLAILPTGGGKSLIYWLSGLQLGGITIVISPLIALIDEQVEKLQAQNIEVLKLHADVKQNDQIALLKKLYNGEFTPPFIFVSPERLALDGLLEQAIEKRKEDIKLVVIDEIHCISQWGDSFRPLYKHIPLFLNNIYSNHWPTILGLSATLNALEVADIQKDFLIKSTNVIKDMQLMRTEINLMAKYFNNEEQKEEAFWDILKKHRGEKILVYVYRKYNKRGVEDFAEKANTAGFKATYFHADMTSKKKQGIVKSYKDNEIDVIFATNAFGMGIDIPDIKVVIHFMIPESIAQYYQEIGRASRNKQSSNAYVLYTDKNIQVKKSHFINRSFPTFEKIEAKFEEIKGDKEGYKNIEYFDDEVLQQCLPYLLEVNAIKIVAKAIHSLKVLENVTDLSLQQAIDATKTKTFLTTVNKKGYSPETLSKLVFEAILKGNCKVTRSLAKCLTVDLLVDDLKPLEEKITWLIKEKKRFKHEQLDYLAYILHGVDNSIELHQEIAHFLGVPKWQLNKIYATEKGDFVRSKSEVIIANTLFTQGISYTYEESLSFPSGKNVTPDFTIERVGKKYYLEHVGMLNNEQYASRWLEKKQLYEQYVPQKLLITYESPNIARDILDVINKL